VEKGLTRGGKGDATQERVCVGTSKASYSSAIFGRSAPRKHRGGEQCQRGGGLGKERKEARRRLKNEDNSRGGLIRKRGGKSMKRQECYWGGGYSLRKQIGIEVGGGWGVTLGTRIPSRARSR